MNETIDGPERLAGLDAGAWLDALDDIGEERGYFEPLGPLHQAIFTDRGPVLLVTFETIEGVRARTPQLPQGFALGDPNGLSQLCLLADGATWFRTRAVYSFFDRLVDDGFFENYDRVIFWGAGPMCGYAACAYSVVAPGSVVLATQPAATLSPALAGWDARFPAARRLCFTDRYGFAPDMIEAVEQAVILFDPDQTEDAAHAGWFHRPNVLRAALRGMGGDIGGDLERMGLLPRLIDLAAAGPIRPAELWPLLRQRRRYIPYLNALIRRLGEQGQTWRQAKAARGAFTRFDGRRFAKAKRVTETRLEAEGRKLPPPVAARQAPAG